MEVIIPQCKDKLGNKQLSRLITKVGVGEKTLRNYQLMLKTNISFCENLPLN